MPTRKTGASRVIQDHSLEILLVHCEGEIGKVILGGAPEIPGATILEKMTYINEVDDSLRRFVTTEPRAHAAMCVNLVLPPVRETADAAFIVFDAARAHPMSGSNCICVVTALLETGRVKMCEPETIVRLDTAAGLVVARAKCADGHCVSVSLDNVPAFAVDLARPILTEKWGVIQADIAFGGLFYALVDVAQIGLTIDPNNARVLAEAGIELHALVTEQVRVSHPEIPGLNHIAFVMFRDSVPDGAVLTCTTLKPGRVDRSPCGTGSSANLATLYARNQISVGERRVSRSVTGGEFVVEAIGEGSVGPYKAIVPRLTGRAFVYGSETLRMANNDPFAQGFRLSDTWGPQMFDL